MDSNNLQRDQNTHGFPTTMSSGSLNNTTGNSELLFSTLRSLARNSETAVTTNGLCNATTSFSSFPISLSDQNTNANNFSANAISTNGSSAWFDPAKFSLLPMYGMFQSSINQSEIYRNNNLSWMDSNIQQAAVAAAAFNAAASLNVMQNFPSFGNLGSSSAGSNLNDDFQRPNNDSKFGSPSNESLKNSLQSPQGVGFQRPNTSSCYSQATTSTAHTPQSTVGPSMPSQSIALSPEECHAGIRIAEFSNSRDNSNVPTAMEELSELDLQDFEDFLMEKPSTSLQPSNSHSQQPNFFTSPELEKISSVGKSIEYRTDELTSADIELDRLVSLVASQNNSEASESHNFEGSPNKKSNSLSDHPVFELPQFTPPESPSAEGPSTSHLLTVGADNDHKQFESSIVKNGASNKNNKANKGCSSTFGGDLVLIPKEIKSEATTHHFNLNKMTLARRNTNRLPIYKQSSNSFQNKPSLMGQQHQLDNDQKSQKQGSDAYSFEDEELSADVPVSSCSLSEMLQNAKRSSELREPKTEKNEDHHSKTAKRKYTKHHSSVMVTPMVKVAEKTNKIHSILAERAKHRTWTSFVSSEIANDDQSVLTDIPIPTCTIRSSSANENACQNSSADTPLLPKLIIRFPKRDNSLNDEQIITSKHSGHKGKKRKKKDKDVDWTETKEWHGTRTKDGHYKGKKHKKCHHKKWKHLKDECAHALPCSSVSLDQSNAFDISDETQSELYAASPFRNEPENAELLTRLNLFERPTERPRRGTFLLPKEDLFNSNCALWRIDNQNLLQKYLPIILDGVKCYHNSSTYSGWCEHYVDEYIAVRVEYIKQSRSENIVCPILPLQDLFPATNFSADDEERIANDELEKSCSSVADQQFWSWITNFVKMMLKHAVSLQFVQHVRQNNDWSYLCALTEIETAVSLCIQNIRNKTPFWPTNFIDSLQLYPRINCVEQFDNNNCRLSHCQACLSGDRDVSSAIQLFSLEEQYDYETFTPLPSSNCANISSSTQPTDFYVCAQCEQFALSYHKAYHLCFHILKSAEEKLELLSAKFPDISVDELIIKCLEDKIWLNTVEESIAIANSVSCVSKDRMNV